MRGNVILSVLHKNLSLIFLLQILLISLLHYHPSFASEINKVYEKSESKPTLFKHGEFFMIASSGETDKIVTNGHHEQIKRRNDDGFNIDEEFPIQKNFNQVFLDTMYPVKETRTSRDILANELDDKFQDRQIWLAVYTGRTSTIIEKRNNRNRRKYSLKQAEERQQFILIPKNQIPSNVLQHLLKKVETGDVLEKSHFTNSTTENSLKGIKVLSLDISGNLTLEELNGESANEADSSQRWISEEIQTPQTSLADPITFLRRGIFAIRQRVGGLRNAFTNNDEKESTKTDEKSQSNEHQDISIRIRNVGNDQCIRNFEYYNKHQRRNIIAPDNIGSMIGNRLVLEIRKRIQNIFGSEHEQVAEKRVHESKDSEENKKNPHVLGTVDCQDYYDTSQKWILKEK